MTELDKKDYKSSIVGLQIPPDKKQKNQSKNILWLVIFVAIFIVVLSMALSSQNRYAKDNTDVKKSSLVEKDKPSDIQERSLKFAENKKQFTAKEAETDKKETIQSKENDNTKSAKTTPSNSKGKELLTVSGYIIPSERIEISPRFMAEVEWIGVKKGDIVKKDDVLVRLDSKEQKAAVAQAEAELKLAQKRLEELLNGTRKEEIDQSQANLNLAEAELRNAESLLERRETLLKKKSISQEEYDNALRNRDTAKAAVEVAKKTFALAKAGPRSETIEQARAIVKSAEAALERAKIYLNWTIIKSPIDGVILEKLATVGEMVVPQSFGNTRGPSTALLSIADLNDLQVECELNESDISKIFINQTCKVSPEAYPDKIYKGYVTEIAPEANRQKGTLQVKVQVKNPDKFLTPELTAKVTFLSVE